jgi:hypothetical protein
MGAGAQAGESSRQDAGKCGLEARAPHRRMSTLADRYDPLTMPAVLSKAHAELDAPWSAATALRAVVRRAPAPAARLPPN